MSTLQSLRLAKFQSVVDDRGSLCIVNGPDKIGFPVKRVYWLHGVPAGAERAGHAHRALHQCYIAVSGSVRVRLDDAHERREMVLDQADTGLLIGPGIWRELYDFAPHSVLLVLASEEFDENDYIRHYDDFHREYHGRGR